LFTAATAESVAAAALLAVSVFETVLARVGAAVAKALLFTIPFLV